MARPRPALDKAFCHYAGLRIDQAEHRKHGQESEIYAVLDRYIVVWRSRSAFEPEAWEPAERAVEAIGRGIPAGANCLLRYHSFHSPTVPGPWDSVRRLAVYPQFARLNYIKQLSTTNIGLNIEATHNRLAHSIGTLDICASLLNIGCQTAPAALLPEPSEALAALTFALLHDAYHGPMGHSLDRIGDIVLADTGEKRIDKAMLIREIEAAHKQEGDLWNMLLLLGTWNDRKVVETWTLPLANIPAHPTSPDSIAKEILVFLTQITDAATLAQKNPKKFWLKELVDGSLDADRLDYLLRDSYYLWEQPIDVTRLANIVGGMRVLDGRVALPRYDKQKRYGLETFKVSRVHWDAAHKRAIEDLLALRASLYMEVYEAPEKRALDEMLVHALIWLLRRELQPDGMPTQPSKMAEVLQALSSVTDDELFHFFYEVGTKPSHRLALSLIHDVAIGRPFTEVWRFDIPLSSLTTAFNDASKIAQSWDYEENELAKETAKALGHGDFLRHSITPDVRILLDRLRGHLKLTEWDEKQAEALIYYIENLYGRRFGGREQLEALLWKELLGVDSDEDHQNVHDLVRGELFTIFERTEWGCLNGGGFDNSDDFARFLLPYPLIFLSIPWVPSGEKDLGLATWAREDNILFHRNCQPVVEEQDFPQRLKQKFYPVSVFIPPMLAQHRDIRIFIGELVWKLILSVAWRDPGSVISQRYKWSSLELPSEITQKGVLLEKPESGGEG